MRPRILIAILLVLVATAPITTLLAHDDAAAKAENATAHWLMVYTLGWSNTFSKYLSHSDCDRAAEIAFGYRCTAKDRPDSIPNCACIPWPEAVAAEKPEAPAPAPKQSPLNPPAPNTQNLPSPLQ